MLEPGVWAWSPAHNTPCRILERQDLWDGPIYQVWVPSLETVVRLRVDQLSSDGQGPGHHPAWLTYLAAAARVADALAGDLLLAPIESSVIPLPHQLLALERALHRDPVRCLLADEVGLGKTIEAGLIMRELKLRGRVRRILVVAPKGLVTQWVAEMETHFGEEFRPLVPADFPAFRRIAGSENVWEAFDQVVCPMDSVKPSDGRRGWSPNRLQEYNRERFEDLV
ncbi:MAG: SNF2-related protein, partial [Rhodothermales bacterium]